MSNLFSKGVIIQVSCGMWSGKKKDNLSDYGVDPAIVAASKGLTENPSLILIDSKWKNKITSFHVSVGRFPSRYGYKMPGRGSIYFIPNENLAAFKTEWELRKNDYIKNIINPFAAEFEAISKQKLEDIERQSHVIYDTNVGNITVTREEFVERRVNDARTVFDSVKDRIADIYYVQLQAHESMSLVHLDPYHESTLISLSEADAEVRKQLVEMATYDAELLGEAHVALWCGALLKRFSEFRESINSSVNTASHLNGNTIRSFADFVDAHTDKCYFSNFLATKNKMRDLVKVLPKDKKNKYAMTIEERNGVATLMSDIVTDVETYRDNLETFKTIKDFTFNDDGTVDIVTDNNAEECAFTTSKKMVRKLEIEI